VPALFTTGPYSLRADVWSSLFPSFIFEGYKEIYRSGLNAINGVLADFNRQYHMWVVARGDYAVNINGFNYNHRGWEFKEYANRRTEYLDLDPWSYYEKAHPFKPRLTFGKPKT